MREETGECAASTKEYDEFGPWIVTITEPDMIPALYKPLFRDAPPPLLLFKIPRKIERRAATPAMDLYDYVIGAFEDYLCVLKRNGKKVAERKIYYRDIAAVKRTHAILKGELTLYLSDDQISIAYNTVSDEIILELIQIILRKQTAADHKAIHFESLPIDYDPNKPGSLDLFFANLCDKLCSINKGLMLAAYQPETGLGRNAAKFFHRLLFKRIRMTRSAFLSDGLVLTVIGNDMTARNKTVDNIAYYYLFIRIRGISDVRTSDYSIKRQLKRLDIYVPNHMFDFIHNADNQSIGQLAEQLRSHIG